MGISAPLFNKILETNHLVKGRLNIKDSDLGLDFIKALKPRKFQYKIPEDNIDSEGNLLKGKTASFTAI